MSIQYCAQIHKVSTLLEMLQKKTQQTTVLLSKQFINLLIIKINSKKYILLKDFCFCSLVQLKPVFDRFDGVHIMMTFFCSCKRQLNKTLRKGFSSFIFSSFIFTSIFSIWRYKTLHITKLYTVYFQ